MTRHFHLPSPADLLDGVLAAVHQAGTMLWTEFHRPGGPRGQGGHAEIDTEIETFLKAQLLALHRCDWRGEELPREGTGHADVWAVDPQDGTSAFLRGHRGSAISVALLRHGQPVLGAIYAPTARADAGDLIAWAEGRRLTRNGQPVGPLAPRRYDAATVVALNEQAGDFAAANHARLAPAALRALPSIAYRLALAAVGEVDAAVSITQGLDSYDIAAGHAALIGAGGVLVQLTGAPVVHGRGGFSGCIGGAPEVVAELVRRKPQAERRVARHPARTAKPCNESLMLDRAQGALLGLLAGDALGAQVEFLSAEAIRARHPEGVTELRPGGTWNLLAGQPTDDGEMALALARSIVAARGYSTEAAGQAYLDWGRSQPFDIGTTTRAGLAALAGRGRANAQSQANGALMRAAPIGIAAKGVPNRAAAWARADAALTHPHPVCAAANAAFCAAIAVGVAGGDRRAMVEAAMEWADVLGDPAGEVVRQCLRAAAEAPPADFMRQQGWVLIALQNAFHRLISGQGLVQALIDTVALGGDTDTNAAICGALLGAVEGRSALPTRWQGLILGCRAVAAPDVAHPRPPSFWADDALDLAEALLMVAAP
ncbi:ADP-ribosylglycohydrolase [Rhodobacter viridis]|uniref:ADP-ribosylglycohydrolase n=1 Tax=Rhodobacter viridis TaxID=1054202 RepID=A0A318TQI0_9RHOB|nr:inositol monophosphatase family protein [Rhodobacter viridis]PYF06934.1 ADP-ribosylglycohydrolase [Rhodobacter viridis]